MIRRRGAGLLAVLGLLVAGCASVPPENAAFQACCQAPVGERAKALVSPGRVAPESPV